MVSSLFGRFGIDFDCDLRLKARQLIVVTVLRKLARTVCIHWCYKGTMLGSREVDDLSDLKQAILGACLNECVGGDRSGVDDLLEQGHQSKPPQKCLGKRASLSTTVSPPEDDVDEIETSLRWLFSEDLAQSSWSCSASFPAPLKLVSALKGSRQKQGLPTKELTVTWAPDVYDPLPTSVLHTVRGKKQQKLKKNNDKKKRGKKWHKGNNSLRGGGKDNKQFHRGGGSLDKWYNYKPLELHGTVVNDASGNLDGFKVGSTDPYCGTSYLKNSLTRMHYSVAEAL
ncbi:Levanase [Gossypium australe]|uniref:Levanase n=1 Tax=Gossypium australe TaxID=47621 RepID=A0A5B6V463_9ROSI|nr:Levanase [Gossypium australe]